MKISPGGFVDDPLIPQIGGNMPVFTIPTIYGIAAGRR